VEPESRRIVIVDASSCVLLQKCGLLAVLAEMVDLVVPRAAFEECASTSLCRRHPDAAAIRILAEAGRVQVRDDVDTVLDLPALGAGEAACIRLFRAGRADAVLTDDGRAIRSCRFLGVPFLTSPRVVVDLARAGRITTSTARAAIERLAVAGRYAPDIIGAAFLALAEPEVKP
jgi:predicted nucleic acid-binding protein